MARFDVHRNTGRGPPYLVDVQHDLFDGLTTRVVVPLVPLKPGDPLLTRLNPVFEVEGRTVAMATPLLAGVPARSLGPVVGSLAKQSADVLAAIDFLLTAV